MTSLHISAEWKPNRFPFGGSFLSVTIDKDELPRQSKSAGHLKIPAEQIRTSSRPNEGKLKLKYLHVRCHVLSGQNSNLKWSDILLDEKK